MSLNEILKLTPKFIHWFLLGNFSEYSDQCTWLMRVICSSRFPEYQEELSKKPEVYQRSMKTFLEWVIEQIDTMEELSPKVWKETYTLTFGDQAENHKSMQILGHMAEQGFSYHDLLRAQIWFMERGIEVEIVHLNELYSEAEKVTPAYLLIARKGLSAFCSPNDFFTEQEVLEKDKKALMRGRVVNKHARHNLCFGPEAQKADYVAGKGTIIPFSEVPLLDYVRNSLKRPFGKKATDLVVEGNYYYDPKSTGIGNHGDSERRIVVGIRVGHSMSFKFQWYHRFKPIGEFYQTTLHHGDLYAMSEKAVGTDWTKSSILTLRHSAGADKFLKPKNDK